MGLLTDLLGDGNATTLDGLDSTDFARSASTGAATYGADLVTNGSFTGSASGWTLGGGAAYGTNDVSVANGSTLEQTINVTNGVLYQIEFSRSSINITNIELGTVASGLIESWKSAAVGLVAATTGAVVLRITAGGSGTIDNVTVREVIPSSARLVGGTEVRLPVSSSLGVGMDAQRSLTTGSNNNAIGYNAQRSLTTGGNNNAVGTNAQYSLTTGAENSAVGTSAQRSLTTGSYNGAVGNNAQRSLTTGNYNNAVGHDAQYSLTTGTNNSAVGYTAQRSLTTGSNNNAVGYAAQYSLTTGSNNNAIGSYSQYSLTTGTNNSAVGINSQYSLTTGSNNNAVGYNSQYAPAGVTANATTTGLRQTAIGHETGQSSATQVSDATALGYRALYGADNATALGANAKADHAASVALGSGTTTTAVDQVMVGTRDIELTGNATKGIVMRSPDGTRYRLTIANGGTVAIAAAP